MGSQEPWTPERIWRAHSEWRWLPPTAHHVVTPEFDMAVTPGAPEMSYVYEFRVEQEDRVEPTLERLKELNVSNGGQGAKIQVTPATRPTDLGARLVRRGYVPADEAEVLAWELRSATGEVRLPTFAPPAGVVVREITTDAEFDQFVEVESPVFQHPPPAPEMVEIFRRESRETRERTGHSDRYLAWSEGVPVGVAGMMITGEVARFWGTGVLESYRRRGIYGALVDARCRAAVARGATLALTTARIGSSGPILKRHGFRVMGPVRMYQSRW